MTPAARIRAGIHVAAFAAMTIAPAALAHAQPSKPVPPSAPSRTGEVAESVVNRNRSMFINFEELSLRASQGGGKEIGEFLDYVLEGSLAHNAAPSVKQRLIAAENNYRAGRQRALRDADVVRGLNAVVDMLDGPAFMRTNKAQVDLLHKMNDARIPHLRAISPRDEDDDPDAMSPVHGAFTALFLATQKILNPYFQQDADAWVTEMRAHMEAATLAPAKVRMPRREPVWHPPAMLDFAIAEPPAESSMMTRAVHRLLDDLGIAR